MELCFLANLVIIFSLLGIIISNVLFGMSVTIINVLFTVLFVMLTNWGCNTIGYYWVAIVITVIHAIGLATSVVLLNGYYNNPEIKDAIKNINKENEAIKKEKEGKK